MLTIDTGIKTDGIACGTAFLYRPSMAISRYIPSGSSKEECKRFHLALKQVKSRLSDLAEQEEIFAAHSEMADDPMLSEEVETKITAEGLPADLLSEELRPVIRHLGEITGRGAIAPDEVLQNIFSKFCIGK